MKYGHTLRFWLFGALALYSLGILPFIALPSRGQDALPSDVRADQYLLAAQAKMKAGEMSSARDYFNKILSLNIAVPVDFHYHYGNCLVQTKNYALAEQELTKYLQETGRNGKFYQDALQLLSTATEGKQQQEAQNQQAMAAKQAKYSRVAEMERLLSKLDNVEVTKTRNNLESTCNYYFYPSGHDVKIEFHDYDNNLNHGDDVDYSSGESEGEFYASDIREVSYDDVIYLKKSIQVKKSLEGAFHLDRTVRNKKWTDTLNKLSGSLVSSKVLEQVKIAWQVAKNYSDISESDVKEYDAYEASEKAKKAAEPDATKESPEPNANYVGSSSGLSPTVQKSISFTNSLGMVFVPLPGTKVFFSKWDTRVGDYRSYVKANSGANNEWEMFGVSLEQDDNHPVISVSWNDAISFCEWLSKMEGKTYRLPTDAEWSVGVGLGSESGNTPEEKSDAIKDAYPWGTQWPPPQSAGNYYTSSLKALANNFKFTTPVDLFQPNRFGLYDMGGNVWQWCQDKYTANNDDRVVRGGSWDHCTPYALLSAHRNHEPPDSRKTDIGFRCVLVNTTKQN